VGLCPELYTVPFAIKLCKFNGAPSVLRQVVDTVWLSAAAAAAGRTAINNNVTDGASLHGMTAGLGKDISRSLIMDCSNQQSSC